MGIDDVAKGGLGIAKRLIPPIDGDPWARFRYDLAVSITLGIGAIFVAFHVLWVCGFLTFMSLAPPFARADEMHDTQYRVVRVQASELDARIQDAKLKVCLAIQAKNQQALDAWARNLEGLKQNYRDAIGHEPNVMGCDELLIGSTTQQ